MRIHLPNSAFLGNIDTFIRSFDPHDSDFLGVTFDEKWTSLHPLALSMTASLGLAARLNNARIECGPIVAPSRNYLEAMELRRFLAIPTIHTVKHEPAGRFIPLTQITNSKGLAHFITEMVPLLHTRPHHADPIKYVISELVRNVLEHANSPIGALVCAQFFKKSNRISIGVADVGVGIRKTIAVSHSVPDDISAIELALTPGITSGTARRFGGTEANAGAGLFFIKSIAKINRNFLVVYSGHGLYKLLKSRPEKIKLYADPKRDKSARKNDFPYWQGTAVGIDISLDASERFDMLLDLIRKTYRSEIREQKKEKFKRARFV